ncbi:Lacal_2735 family protein [bacterium]|nr:Lacal_2735 family protein [bacterium]
MFGLFKKKSEREKLLAVYKKLKEQAFILSKTNRSESDRLEKEAHDISLKIDLIDKEKNDDKKD